MLRTQSHSLKRASLEEVLKKLPWLTSEDQLQEAGRANRCAPANGSCADNEGLTTIPSVQLFDEPCAVHESLRAFACSCIDTDTVEVLYIA